VVVEHRLDLVARYAERIIVMDAGKIVADGNLEETLDEKFDLLAGLGVGIPRVSLLWAALRRDGLVSGKVPTRVEDAASSLGGMMSQ
jgi:energy-coupling factor transport system ATP-binding protein